MSGKTFTPQELAKFSGATADGPVYVAIKGIVFDVTANRQQYAPGQGYSIFAGKDASCALGKSSLKAEDCHADYSGLNDEEMKTLDNWVAFFQKKYPVVGHTAAAGTQ
ncbi:cytochrome b5-like heme/steroid binding domain-containing protein [Entophlyctis helioformis]|nr:cytochrome b5-like heme/steroid binding domain-containing protein [Entophlyctis helioformis]